MSRGLTRLETSIMRAIELDEVEHLVDLGCTDQVDLNFFQEVSLVSKNDF